MLQAEARAGLAVAAAPQFFRPLATSGSVAVILAEKRQCFSAPFNANSLSLALIKLFRRQQLKVLFLSTSLQIFLTEIVKTNL